MNGYSIVLSRNISEGYYRKLKPESSEIYRKWRVPSFAINNAELQKWCRERKSKRLFELQAEACEWALQILRKNDESLDISKARRETIASDIADVANKLRETKKPVKYDGFGPEEFVPFSKPDKDDPFAPKK